MIVYILQTFILIHFLRYSSVKQKFRYLWVPPTDSYGPVGGSQCNDDTHRTLQDVKGIRERYDDFAVYDDDDIVQSWIRGMRLPCNVPRRRKNHRVSSSISAEPRPVYIFNRIHRKSGRRGIHCSFGQVKFLLTCKKKERRQKGRNTGQDIFGRRNKWGSLYPFRSACTPLVSNVPFDQLIIFSIPVFEAPWSKRALISWDRCCAPTLRMNRAPSAGNPLDNLDEVV